MNDAPPQPSAAALTTPRADAAAVRETLRRPERLAALRDADLLDASPEESLDRITRLAAAMLRAPLTLISLVDDKRQYFKSLHGALPEPWGTSRETDLEHSFCKHVVADERTLLVADARRDPTLKTNLAVPDLSVLAYLGVPLRTAEGAVLGSFCAIDHRAREWSAAEVATITDLAALAAREIDLRARARAIERERGTAVLLGRRLSTMYKAAAALLEAASIEEAAPRILEALCRDSEWRCAAILLAGDADDRLHFERTWSTGDPAVERFLESTRGRSFGPGEGIPGEVWRSGAAQWVKDVGVEEAYLRRDAARAAGLRSAIFFPIGNERRCHGVVELYYGDVREPDDDTLGLLAGFGGQVGQFVERMRARAASHLADRQTRAVVDGALDAIVTSDDRGTIVDWNPRAVELFGWSREEAIGRTIGELIVPPSLRPGHESGMDRYRSTGVPHVIGRRVELTAMRRDRTEFPIELSLIKRPDPHVTSFSAFIRDLSEQRRSEELLAHQQAGLRTLSGLAAARTLAPDERYQAALRAGAAHLGLSIGTLARIEDDVVTITHSVGAHAPVAPGTTYPLEETYYTAILRASRAASEEALPATVPAERRRAPRPPRSAVVAVEKISASPYRDNPAFAQRGLEAYIGTAIQVNGRDVGTVSFLDPAPRARPFDPGEIDFMLLLAGAIGAAMEADDAEAALREDIAERARLEAELRATAAQLRERLEGQRQFDALLGHELRTPLVAVRSFAALVRQGTMPPERIREYADLLDQDAQRAGRLITAMLDLDRIALGQAPLIIERVHVRELMDAVIATLALAQPTRTVRYTGPDGLVLDGDHDRLTQVLTNLVENGLKSSAAEAAVEVGATVLGDEVDLAVRDHGRGIAAADLEGVFSRREDATGAGDRSLAGNGLGLQLTRAIIEQHHGRIWAESDGPGTGATFHVRLPLRQETT